MFEIKDVAEPVKTRRVVSLAGKDIGTLGFTNDTSKYHAVLRLDDFMGWSSALSSLGQPDCLSCLLQGLGDTEEEAIKDAFTQVKSKMEKLASGVDKLQSAFFETAGAGHES
ncbi:hypothetical protein [Desulfotalea psychrophila]|uniref:Uncharacterized protein n=1 Tax=Desulfotalea psychrophila (strain LSv54 / DSM 12343) TaxID=177439 RepID=Q6AMX2_DESPS|nr:hypothetical protein [Desulfotalea psychrophila]CAG36302.1 unknown protein [Desulfotalea psychrophila LSv54]